MPSDSIFSKFAGQRWFSIGLLGLTAVLLIIVSLRLGRKVPPLPPLNHSTGVPALPVTLDKIEQLSSKTAFMRIRPFSNGMHPFYTLHFQPPPPPPKPTPTPPPSTPPPPVQPVVQKIPVLYQGVYETAAGGKKAFVVVNGKLSVLGPGATITHDWTVANIAVKDVTITNRALQTNTLKFNIPAELEVPAP